MFLVLWYILAKKNLIVINISVCLTENEILWENTTSFDCVGTGEQRMRLERVSAILDIGDVGTGVFTKWETLACFGVVSLLYMSILVLRIYRIPISPSWERWAASL